MKKKVIFFLLVLVACCVSDDVQAGLIQGYFSGNIDINGQLDELADGASFSGQFIYNTDAVPSFTSSSGDVSYAFVPGALMELSFSLTGSEDIYTYNESFLNTDTQVTYNGAGDYTLDFDGLNGQNNFINGLDLQWAELILDYSDTVVANPDFPVILPDADNLIAGSSYAGSVLYMWVMDNQGVNPGSAQINGNITSLSLQQYPQPVPEPATIALVASGLFCFAGYRKKRKGLSTS